MYIAGMVPPLEHPKKEVRKVLKQARAAIESVPGLRVVRVEPYGAQHQPAQTA